MNSTLNMNILSPFSLQHASAATPIARMQPQPATQVKMHPRNVRFIVLHCSATRSNMTYSPLSLERDHRARGFVTAGYHYYITREGQIVQFRSIYEAGAHARGFNRCSIGICYEGGLSPAGTPADTRTARQKTALRDLLDSLRTVFPQAVILGHRDLSPDINGDGVITKNEYMKACPCFDAIPEYAHL